MPTSEKKLARYKAIFEKCDTDNNNLICFNELKAFLRSRDHGKTLPEDQIMYIFKLADQNGNKAINFDEFVNILEHPDFKHLFEYYMNCYVNFLIPKQKLPPQITSYEVTYQGIAEETTLVNPLYQRRTSIQSVSVDLVTKEEDSTYLSAFTCCPPPIAMILISFLELACFLTDEITEKNSSLTGTGITAQVFIYEPARRHEAWRFLTYMLVHVGYMHIIVNLCFQLLLGIPLEMVHKWWRVTLLYFLGVIAGSLTTSVTDPRVRLAGASGGVYCLLTAHISTIIMNWSEMQYPLLQIAVFGIVIFCDLGSSIYNRYCLNIDSQVGYAAHFGGALAGLLVGIYLLKNLNVKNCERYLWWAAVVLYAILMTIAIFLNIFLPHRYPAAAS